MDVIHYIEGMRNETQVVQLMQRIDKLPGFLTLEEGYTLFKLAETWPVEGDTIEIGSFKGRSTCFLGSGCRRGADRIRDRQTISRATRRVDICRRRD